MLFLSENLNNGGGQRLMRQAALRPLQFLLPQSVKGLSCVLLPPSAN